MNKISVSGLLACFLVCSASAQVSDPTQVGKDAATNQVNSDMSNEANKGINKAEQGIGNMFKKKNKPPKTDTLQPKPTQAQSANASATSTAQGPSLKAYDNYDFVPGEKILFEDNFQDDPKGEFPSHWRLGYGQGVVAEFDGKKVFAMTEGEQGDRAVVMEARMKAKSDYMPANFTIEFDMYPASDANDENINNNWAGVNLYGTEETVNTYADLFITSEQMELSSENLADGTKQIPENIGGANFVNKWHHVAIAFRDKQMKIYLDQIRLYVIPEVKNGSPNKFGIHIAGKCVVTNIRLAEGGGMNMLGKKFTDAKIVTHGINFDIDKSTIRPESMGTLNMIVQVMKDNPDLKFDVEGFTDNTGNPAHNLSLSDARANAVKTQLIAMGISASRLTAKGFGETKPLADNSTPEGRANNRRVEFVKI